MLWMRMLMLMLQMVMMRTMTKTRHKHNMLIVHFSCALNGKYILLAYGGYRFSNAVFSQSQVYQRCACRFKRFSMVCLLMYRLMNAAMPSVRTVSSLSLSGHVKSGKCISPAGLTALHKAMACTGLRTLSYFDFKF